jgi:hypothetical protein
MSVSKSSDTKDVSLDSEGKFVLTCPGCAKRFQLLDKAVFGKRVTCKACKAPFIVDGSVLAEYEPADLPKPKATEVMDSLKPDAASSSEGREGRSFELIENPTQSVSPTMNVDESPKKFYKEFFGDCRNVLSDLNMPGTRLLILIPIGIGMSLVNEFENHAFYFISMWILQLVFCAACGWVLAYNNRRTILICACIAPVLWVDTARTAFVYRFEKQLDYRITESIWRLGGWKFHESIVDTKSHASMEGPVSESGKKHGEWETVLLNPFSKTKEYYWYGEKVTEGEWYLRNK